MTFAISRGVPEADVVFTAAMMLGPASFHLQEGSEASNSAARRAIEHHVSPVRAMADEGVTMVERGAGSLYHLRDRVVPRVAIALKPQPAFDKGRTRWRVCMGVRNRARSRATSCRHLAVCMKAVAPSRSNTEQFILPLR